MTTTELSAYTTTQPTLVPRAGLVVDNPSSAGGPSLFAFFTEDWITLQTFVVQALQLPIALGDFEAKYGTVSDEAQIEGCVAAMKQVQDLSVDFGDPTALIEQLATDPRILQGDTAPTQIYLHILWFANKLYDTAVTFNQTLSQFITLLNSTPVDQRQALVTSILTGPGGLQSSAESMAQLANDLNQSMAAFKLKLTPATQALSTYSSQSGKLYQDVQSTITMDLLDIVSFQNAANEAYKLWRDLTISAVSVSVGLMVLTGGMAWPLAGISAGVLGCLAHKARETYDAVVSKLNAAEADELKKIQLLMDLNTFNLQMAPVNTAAQNFLQTLETVEGVWLAIASDLAYIAKTFTPDQLQNLSVLQEAMQLADATQDWQIIAQKADEFRSNSLVSYQISSFGATLPPNPSDN